MDEAAERELERVVNRAWIGGAVRHDATITLVEYDPEWPRLFRREAERIRGALPERVVVALEHVGSTSVPGLAAKPIIDILLVVPDSADEAAYVPALESVGYRLVIREPHWHEHRMFKGPDTDVNLHVHTAGDAEAERMPAFRDRLRADAADRVLYERTKRELAARRWSYVQGYAEAKSGVVERIMAHARRA
ncbi:GrpB family protein [Saccharothrix coeruleofusca]|uniref:GrpB family protein n=1 Tax=Saccharothrix coeruleofusca TaxID=33919 RepID=A0A918AMZ6_9PSEU|nr:GrpB family protein [Saccharothrix coeruleofusca]MBP2336312.1 GrpB-like predicted nucleotidyltransferase (UPF0157 family) [Saccharothrix coeruleofusca]GGP53957.1 hypothetical protein GCM10010185_27890 [Saccharothrix coeruleofusca]